MYNDSVRGVIKVLLQRSVPSRLMYIAEQPRKHHGLCFCNPRHCCVEGAESLIRFLHMVVVS